MVLYIKNDPGLGQFLCIENIWCGAKAERKQEETKECHNSTKRELDYTLIPVVHLMCAKYVRPRYLSFLFILIS